MADTRAVIIGGSIAGLSTAKMLSDYFDRVTVIERDQYPVEIADRAGVPQGRHFHILLARGLLEFERLFPGFQQMCLGRGGWMYDPPWETINLRSDGWSSQRRSGLMSLCASRALMESVVRDMTRPVANVEILEKTDVIALTTRTDRSECSGVITRSRAGAANQRIAADLVIDASGTASKAPNWLREAGIEPPDEILVDPLGAYSSRFYRGAAPDRWPSEWWWSHVYIARDYSSQNRDTMSVHLGRLEHDLWHLSIQALGDQRPPSDEAAFNKMLSTLRSPIIHEMTRIMEPISPVHATRALQSRWRRYDRWKHPLQKFIAIGDAACRFNPLAAQGMSVTAVSVSILEKCLRRYGPRDVRLPHRFFAAQARFQSHPWRIAVSADLHFPFTQGKRSLSMKLFSRYMDAVGLAAGNQTVRRALNQTSNLLEPISSLFVPKVLIPVVASGLQLVARRTMEKLIAWGEQEPASDVSAQSYELPTRAL